MNFGEQIKSLRSHEGLTQEQFAEKLNVTRQAVSNWENNRNLPDIEMLILIAQTFHISLDNLILGGNKEMNEMKKATEQNLMVKKLVKDGSETRRTKMNMVSASIGAVLMVMGVMCLVIKAFSVEYVDALGNLHENFFLLPIGFLFIFAGMAVIFTTCGVCIAKRRRE